MSRLTWFASCLLTLALTGLVVAPSAGASTTVSSECTVAAHRGDHTHYTEDGMGAFGQAVADGAEWLEGDARVTSDQHVMLMHDSTVGRTTNGAGRVSRKTARQLRRLRLNDGVYAPPFASQLLNLAEATDRKVLLELKAMGTSTSYRRLAASIRAVGVERVTVQSFSATRLVRIKRLVPGLRTAIASRTALPASTVQAYGGIVIEQSAITDEWLASVAGLPVFAWTVDARAEWERLSRRVDAIITNDPAGYIAARSALCGP